MISHINVHHADICPHSSKNLQNRRDEAEKQEPAAAAAPPRSTGRSQQQSLKDSVRGSVVVEPGVPYTRSNLRFEMIMVFVLMLIVACSLPVSIIEHWAFKALLFFLDPRLTSINFPGRTWA
jgi:hypothetical protein